MVWTGTDCLCGHPLIEHNRETIRCSVCNRRYRIHRGRCVVDTPRHPAVDLLDEALYGPRP